MSKILDIDFRTGSLIEKVNGVLPTNIGVGKLSQQTKGFGLTTKSTTYSLDYGFSLPLSTDFTMIWYFNPTTGLSFFGTDSYNNGFSLIYYGGGVARLYLHYYVIYIGYIIENKDNCIILKRTGNIYESSVNGSSFTIIGTYSGGIIGTRSFRVYDLPVFNAAINSYLYKITIDNTAFTQQQANREYKEFLNSKPVAQTKRNFAYELQKPKDLSKETGLVAAYNMIPQNGIVTDISNNGNNLTVEGVPQYSRNGMVFSFGDRNVPNYLNSASIVSGNYKTFVFRIKLNRDINSSSETQIVWSNNASNDPYIPIGGGFTSLISNETMGMVNSVVGEYTVIKDSFMKGQTLNIVFVWNGTRYEIWINGIERTVYTAWNGHVSLLSNISFILGNRITTTKNGIIYVGVQDELIDFKIDGNSWTEDQIKKYHNDWAEEINFIEDFKYEPADGTNITPKGWIKGTGNFKIAELTEDDPVLSHLKKGIKILECTTIGDIKHQFNKDEYVDGGYIEMDYYNGSLWTHISSVVDIAISTYSWLSYSTGIIVYTLNVGDKIANIKYTKGVII